MLCHLHFAWVGAAVLRLKGSAAVVCDALSGVMLKSASVLRMRVFDAASVSEEWLFW